MVQSRDTGKPNVKRRVPPLRGLRWKLTLSYTLVTVGAVVVAELVYFAAVYVIGLYIQETVPLSELLPFVGLSALILAIPTAVLGLIFGFITARGLTRRLQRLSAASESWSRGDFSAVIRDQSRDELGQLSRELNDMSGQLESLLWAREDLATLETRNRFARDLHDSVKQQVYAASLQVDTARASAGEDTTTESHLARTNELLAQAQKELNVLIHEMRPTTIEDEGLASALREYAAGWSRGSGIPARVRASEEDKRELPLEVKQAVFRVAQEALANVSKHSGASEAELELSHSAKSVNLRVADDGGGFDTMEDPGEGFGFRSMDERMSRLGGRMDVKSWPGEGTRVSCSCPLDGAAASESQGA